jgi:hypothetical protein
MTEIPDEDRDRRDEDESARNSLAGDVARKLDGDIDEPDQGRSGTGPEDAAG